MRFPTATGWLSAALVVGGASSAPMFIAQAGSPPASGQAPRAPGAGQAPRAPATGQAPRAPAAPQAPAIPAPAQGPVRAVPEVLDFGFVQPHTKLEGTIALVNDLDRPLTIVAAQPSCQCTTVDLVGKVIPAKGKLDFPVSMKVSSTGLKLASVQIAIDGLDSVVRPELRAEVVYPVRGFTQNTPGGTKDPFIDAATDPRRVRGEVVVESLDGKPFSILSVGMKPPRFLDWDPTQPPRSSYRVRYDVSAPDCASMPRYLIIETDRLDAPLIDMRVRHECTHIRPVISFAEFRANAGVLSPSVPGTFEIEIKKMKTPRGPAKVRSVTSTREDLKAELVEQTFDGESVLAKVRITPQPGTSGVMLFPVRFTVDVPGQTKPVEETLLVYCKAVP